jgi:hypothetical protein
MMASACSVLKEWERGALDDSVRGARDVILFHPRSRA